MPTDSRSALKPRPVSPMDPAEDIVPGQFMGVTVPFERARFVVLPIPYERTTSYKKGTERGPEKFIEGSLGCELWDEELKIQTYKAGLHTLPAFRSEEPAESFFPKLEAEVRRLARLKDKTLFSIGGEHSISQALIPPFAEAYPGLSVLHIDAHADLRPNYEGSPHNHACALYPVSRICRVVQVGIRSVAEEEAHLTNAGNVLTFFRHEHRDMRRLIPRVLKGLSEVVYVTIDLDGFDPSLIPGVGTPQPDGLSWSEGLELLRAVVSRKKVVGVDLMELCPLRDTVQSELAAAKLAYRIMGYLWSKEKHGRL